MELFKQYVVDKIYNNVLIVNGWKQGLLYDFNNMSITNYSDDNNSSSYNFHRNGKLNEKISYYNGVQHGMYYYRIDTRISWNNTSQLNFIQKYLYNGLYYVYHHYNR